MQILAAFLFSIRGCTVGIKTFKITSNMTYVNI
jgi:hypothetical protein